MPQTGYCLPCFLFTGELLLPPLVWQRFTGSGRVEVFSRGLAQATRRNDVDTRWLRETGTIAAKDVMSADDFWQVENQSEEKFDKVRKPALKAAHALLK